MRSTLKKSLYLGLAALSFASVAGVANNANAAKHHKATKTYAKASYKNIPNQGNSNVAYNVTGSNALFNKPGTVKGAKTVASKATMSDLASAKENFMVYQTAVTNRGSKYIKVVSFNKQYRGWIYAGNNNSASYGTGVNQVNLATQATPQYSSVYLSNPGQTALKSTPEGAQFNASSDNFSHTGFVHNDKFNVDAAQTVSKTGTTWYHLVDQNDNTINGWVPSNQVRLTNDSNYFDNRNDIMVNYTYNGKVVKSAPMSVNGDAKQDNSNVLNAKSDSNNFADQINSNINNTGNSNSPLYNTPYKNTDGNYSARNDVNLQYVEAGDTVNVPVQNVNGNNTVASKFNLHVINPNYNGISNLNTGAIKSVSLNNSDLNAQAYGQSTRQGVDMNTVLKSDSDNLSDINSGLFNDSKINTDNPDSLAVLIGTTNHTNNTTNVLPEKAYNSDSDAASNDATKQTKTIGTNDSYHYDYVLNVKATRDNNNNKNYGQNIDLYYNAVPVINNGSTYNDSTSFFG